MSANKLDKKILSLTETILGDATDAQKKAWIPFLESMITDVDSPAEKKSSSKKADKASPDSEDSPESSPAEDSPDSEDSPASSPDSEDSPAEDSPEEKKSSKKSGSKKADKKASPDSEDSPEASPDSEDSPEASPDSEDSPAASPDSEDSPEEKKSSSKKSSSKKDTEEDDAVDYSSMSERALAKHLTEEKKLDKDTVKAIAKDKKKLVKLAKAFDEQFATFSKMKLDKLEKLVKKNGITVSFGRGRSNDEKKVRIIAQTLAANGIAG